MSSFEGSRTPNIFNHQKNTIFTKPKWPPSRRSHSLSSSPSISSGSSSYSFRSFSIEDDSPPPSPSQRIPFSWESIPGIPKYQITKRVNSSKKNNSNYLPLPPSAALSSSKPNFNKKKHIVSMRNNDPFFQALVECSKSGDEEDDEDKDMDMFGSFLKGHAKSLSHGFGFVNFSCKNTCTVAESLVLFPKEQPRKISYGVIKKRSG